MFNRNSSPATESATVTVQDGVIAAAWDITPAEWMQLTESERRDKRDRVIYAPHFSTATA